MRGAMVACICGNFTCVCRDLKGKDLSALTIYLERKHSGFKLYERRLIKQVVPYETLKCI